MALITRFPSLNFFFFFSFGKATAFVLGFSVSFSSLRDCFLIQTRQGRFRSLQLLFDYKSLSIALLKLLKSQVILFQLEDSVSLSDDCGLDCSKSYIIERFLKKCFNQWYLDHRNKLHYDPAFDSTSSAASCNQKTKPTNPNKPAPQKETPSKHHPPNQPENPCLEGRGSTGIRSERQTTKSYFCPLPAALADRETLFFTNH